MMFVAFLKHRINKISIRFKLIGAIVLILLVPIILINVFYISKSRSFLKNEVNNSLINVSSQISLLVEDKIESVDKLSSTLFSYNYRDILSRPTYQPDSIQMYNDTKEIEKFLSFIINQSNAIEGVYIFTVNGNRFYKSNLSQIKAPYNVKNEEWYHDLLDNNEKIKVFGIHNSWPADLIESSADKVYSVAKKLDNLDGTELCVILIDINPSQISECVSQFTSNHSSIYLVLDDANCVVYGSDLFSEGDVISDMGLLELLNSGDISANLVLLGNSYFVTYTISAISGWKIISITPDNVVKDYIGRLDPFNLMLILMVFALLVAFYWFVNRIIIIPIQSLNSIMKQAENGDFTMQVDIKSHDEIGCMSENFNTMINKINHLIEGEYKNKLLLKESEFKALEAQINPHFLYNTLQLISSMAIVYDVDCIDHVAKDLGYMLRYSIRDLLTPVRLEDELNHVRKYIEIQKIRLDDSFYYEEDIEDTVLDCSVMKLMLQPLVENAFTHGFSNTVENCVITIKIQQIEDKLVINITDNGCGISPERLSQIREMLYGGDDNKAKLKPAIGIGIENVYLRLKMFYRDCFDFQISSENRCGTHIILILPNRI